MEYEYISSSYRCSKNRPIIILKRRKPPPELLGVREVKILIRIFEDVLDMQERNVDRDNKMVMYIDKLVDLMREEPQKEEVIIRLEELKRRIKRKQK